jgi:methylenetetrahydrofolate--tRNA-(uracil-5-)-methyltransferase
MSRGDRALAGRMAAADRFGQRLEAPPPTTALGALVNHITGGASAQTFQPMNINFGLFPPLADEERYKRSHLGRKPALSARALNDLAVWLDGARQAAA